MSFRESFYQTKQLLVNRLNDFGILSANMNMGWTTLLTIEQNTRITIDVPLNLIYTDEFLITGTLETSTYSRLNGKTVKLKVGNTVVDTTTTNVNGEYSFTHTPVSTGTHSFQVIFEGTNVHAASESSTVTREVGKETSVMNLDAQSTKHYGDNVILGGTLLTDDGEYIKNASVKYYVGNSLVDTLTTDNYGVFTAPTRTISELDILVVQFVYEGDSNYTSVSANQIVDVYQKDLRLTSNKDILSYADNESATITAQLIDDAPTPQNLAIANQKILFSDGSQDFTEQRTINDMSEVDVTLPNNDGCILEFEAYGQIAFSVKNSSGTEVQIAQISTSDFDTYKIVDSGSDIKVYKNGTLQYSYGLTSSDYVNIKQFYIWGAGGYVKTFTMKFMCKTDSTGKASYVYASQGIGDVTITANIEGSLLTKTYEVEDCKWSDIAKSSEVSNYSTNSTSISYDSTNQAYKLMKTGSDGLSSVTRNTLKFANNVKIEADVMMSGSLTNIQVGLGLLNSSTSVGVDAKRYSGFSSSSYSMSIVESTRTGYGSNEVTESLTASELQLNTWYHIILEIDGTDITYTYKQGDTVIKTLTTSSSVLDSSNNEFAIWVGFRNNNSAGYFKNIKIKPL